MPRLAANLSMMFNEAPFMERFGLAAKAGFKGVEYLFPYDFSAADIAAELKGNGLEQVLFDFPAGDWAGGDRGLGCLPDRKGEFQDGVGKAIEYAKALGCTRLTVLAGKAPADVGSDKLSDTLVDNLAFAGKAVDGSGITVVLEAINTIDIPGYFVTNTKQARALVEASKSPNVKLQYDIYHMQIMEGDLARTIKANLDLIGHFQLADNPGRNEPGTGEINYDFLLPYIDSLGFDGWIGCEYKPKGETVAGLGWTKKWL